jgi:2',5'-phosphodiesterase
MNYLSVYSEKTNTSQNIKLSFSFGDRKFNMSRAASEPVGKTLKRIGISIQKANAKAQDGTKTKAKKQEVVNNIPVALLLPNGEALDSEILNNAQAWKDGNILNICQSKYLVEENTPIVHSAKIPSVIMAGFPVVPTVKLEFADETHSQFKWYKKVAASVSESNPMQKGQAEDANESETIWTEISQEFIYIPNVTDIGCVLKMSCKAAGIEKIAHEWFDITAASEVAAGPGTMPFDSRHLYTAKPISDSSVFRVVSYNILADCYLQDDAICQAWFGYCPKYALAIDYRQQLLLKEIVGYHGDIVCLQECGRRLFDDYLNPMMASQGFKGVVKYKSGVMLEGEAIFFNNSKFTLISQHNFELKDCFMNDPCNKELHNKVHTVPEVYEKLTSLATVAQIIILRCVERPQDYICVVNTHLYFRPNAPCIRNLQTLIVLNMLRKTIAGLELELKEKHVPDSYQIGVVFCGDFNSLPWSGVVQLLTDGTLPNHHANWIIPVEKPEQAITSLKMPDCNQEFEFQNCCGFPEFTTYTEGFSGVIDYIFASKKHFEVDSVIPVPSKEELQLYTAIPSPVMPSDHIALICELKWK